MEDIFAKAITVPNDVLVNQVAGESVLLNLDGGRYFGLDEMGTDMWRALTGCATVQAAYERLLNEFDVDPATLKRDLVALLERLVEHRLFTLVEP